MPFAVNKTDGRPAARGAHPARLLLLGIIGASLVTLLAASWPLGTAGAAAAPVVAIDPNRGPCSTRPVVHGVGFPAGAAISIFSERTSPPGEKAGQQIAQTTAGADGAFAVSLLVINGDCIDLDERTPDGTQYAFTAAVAGVDGGPAARTVFTIDRAVAAMPTLILEPSSGPCDSRVTARGKGFAPGLHLVLQRGTDNGPIVARATVADDGAFAVPFTITCGPTDPLGAEFRIIASPDKAAGQPGYERQRASAVFIVTTSGAPRERYFPETGHYVGGRFLEYWEQHGGLAINGYPISEKFQQRLEDGNIYTVQYFERTRLEWHPENAAPYDVLLGQFGRRIHPADQPSKAIPGQRFFPETGHNVGGRFLAYWETYGGLAQFGYPLSEEFEERLEDGRVYRVQYFERARFEHHPENGAEWDVLLGHFGRRILAETTGR